MRRLTIPVLLVILLIASLPAPAQNTQPSIPAVEISDPPMIDGDLSDPCWQEAPQVTDFRWPQDGTAAPEQTTAWICYDQENIYIAFLCKDSQPNRIMAQQKKRGGDIGSDDWVGVNIDRYCNQERIIWFDVSAGGVQVERLESGDASKIEWRGDWSAAAKRVDDGYIVEMRIPFSILQYDAKSTKMALCFSRYHARTDRWWKSPDLGPDNDSRKYMLWEGLNLPRLKTRPLVLAYSLFGTGDESPRRMGLDIKHALSPSTTGVFTLNPDFFNVEQQVDSVDFTYTERRLPDSRPFFLEGGGYFPGHDVLYTRRIGEIDFGGKFSGRVGEYNLGFMHAGRLDKENHTVFKSRREWASKGHVEVAGSYSDDIGLSAWTGHVNGAYRFYDKDGQKMQVVVTSSTTHNSNLQGKGHRIEGGLFSWGRPRVLSWTLVRQQVEADYDPYIGSWPDTDVDGWHLDMNVYDEPSTGNIPYWRIGFAGKALNRTDGSLYYNSVGLNGGLVWDNGTSMWINLDSSNRPPNHDNLARVSYWWGERNLYRNGGVSLGVGKLAGGDYLYYRVTQGWNVTDRLSVRSSYEHSTIKEPSPDAFSSGQWILTLAYDLDNERTLAGRLVSREGKSNVYLAFRQRVRAGLDAFLIVGDPNADSTTNSLALKLVRPL